jgi:acetyl-CoA synthetase
MIKILISILCNTEEAQNLTWFVPFLNAMGGNLIDGDVNWFSGGKLNASYNCLDRHLKDKADSIALVWESDEPGQGHSYTYSELTKQVCRIANLMKSIGVRMGDVVTLYMPMIPELPMTMLACSRIGAIHSVVFAGFSAESLRDRVNSCNSKWIFTADYGVRGGKHTPLKKITDDVCMLFI